MIDPQEAIKAIDVQLLMQEAMGNVSIPGLREAVFACTPVPVQLPAATLTDAAFLADFVVPWLAERLHAGEALSDIHADYQRCTDITWYWRDADHLHPMVTMGYLALDDSDVRALLAYDDDALCALMAVRRSVNVEDFECPALYWGDFRCPWMIVFELQEFADFLETLGPNLCLRCLNLDKEIDLGPVIVHVRAIAADLKASDSKASDLKALLVYS